MLKPNTYSLVKGNWTIRYSFKVPILGYLKMPIDTHHTQFYVILKVKIYNMFDEAMKMIEAKKSQ